LSSPLQLLYAQPERAVWGGIVAVSRGYDRAGAAVTLAVSAAAWWMSGRFPPDARVFPRMVLAMLGVLSLLWLIRTFLPADSRFAEPKVEDEPANEPFFVHVGYFAGSIAVIAAYIFLVGTLGYFTSTILFIPVMAILLGYYRPLGILLTTAAFAGGIYIVFVLLFDRRLPAEFFARWQLF
jgi:putative tricarboxylic transport membrane protein